MVQEEVKARIDMRLSSSQKAVFERASKLAGFKTLSEYIISLVTEKSYELIEKDERILISKRDREKFFDAITNPQEPSADLLLAFEKYNEINKEFNNGSVPFRKKPQKR